MKRQPNLVPTATMQLAAVLLLSAGILCPGTARGQTTTCVKPSDFYATPQAGVNPAVLGLLEIDPAVGAGGTIHVLSVTDCNSDGLLDLFIPWSRSEAVQPATFDFRQVCDTGLPLEVNITFSHLGDDVLWEAIRGSSIVDSQVTVLTPTLQTVTLTDPLGIEFVVIREGFNVCVHEICWMCPPAAAAMVRGDCNSDRRVDLNDAVFLREYLSRSGRTPGCKTACDINADGRLDDADVVALVNFLLRGGNPPASPFPDCGPAPAGRLGCERGTCD